MSFAKQPESEGYDQCPPPPYTAGYGTAMDANACSGKPNTQGFVGQQVPQGYVGQQVPQGYVGNPVIPSQTVIVQGHPTQPGQMVYHYPVIQAQPLLGSPPQGTPPRDFMVMAIFATVFCFFPTGIVAILKASEAKSAILSGDFQRANTASQRARRYINISIVLGIVCYVILIICTVLLFNYIHEVYRQQLREHDMHY